MPSISYKCICCGSNRLLKSQSILSPFFAYKMFDSLYKENINILAITTSEIKISVLIDEINVENAVNKLHSVFDLD